MTLPAYKVLHLLGLMMLFGSLGGLAVLGALGADPSRSKPFKAILNAFHGVGLVLMLVAGFGLLAKTGMAKPGDWAGWVHAKFVLWLLFGAAVVPFKRMAGAARLWLLIYVVLGAVAAWLALFKPF